MRLEGKVAVVTGGGKGIGRVYARGLAQEGAKVVAADIDQAAAMDAEKELTGAGHEAIGMGVDVADEASVTQMIKRTVDRFGRLDVMVNNAGLFVALPVHKVPWQDITVEEWDRVMAVNLKGVFLCSRGVIPFMRDQGGGSIINISSQAVFDGGRSRIHYVASKAGVVGLTRALARMVGQYQIRVNAIAPGGTESDTVLAARAAAPAAPPITGPTTAELRAIKRAEVPEDIVGTVIFLASNESAFITGQTSMVDGGQNFI
ncbi:MAG: SDR family NAD(P)-dependent oxidoreductase [Chloroflexota bacterium]|mgnify:CR=1 FL=1